MGVDALDSDGFAGAGVFSCGNVGRGIMVSDKEKAIFAQVIAYGKQYDVEKLVLFGSRARRDHMEKSDIDLAVYGCADCDNFYYDIQEKVWTLLEFDIINMEEKVSESLRQEISRDGVVLYEKV